MKRRTVLKLLALTGGGVAIGVWLTDNDTAVVELLRTELSREKNTERDLQQAWFANAWLRLYPDDSMVLQVPSSEMGQGVMTALPMLLAEELDADWARIRVEHAPVHHVYRNPTNNRQSTGNSASIRGFHHTLRLAGAAIREALLRAAAARWQVAVSTLSTRDNLISDAAGEHRLRYGELLQEMGAFPLAENSVLKTPDKFRLLNSPLRRLDTPAKINGSAVFGQDVTLPGLLVAVVARCPVFKGSVANFNDTDARAVNGVVDVVKIGSGIAVVARHFWAAQQGREKLRVTWNEGPLATQNDAAILQLLRNSIGQGTVVEKIGDVTPHLEGKSLISAEYFTPFLAHTCMEPMNCTAWVQDRRCDIWAPTQSPERARKAAAGIAGMSKDHVFVHTTFLGGGFGRRSEQDFVIEAVEISKLLGAPVKVLWTREDDIQHDFYRPITLNKLSAHLDANGMPLAIRHSIAAPSLLDRFVPFSKVVLRGKDPTAVDGVLDNKYRIPNFELNYANVDTGIPVGFWRSVGYSQNVFVSECFLDEIALAGNQNPYQLRRTLLQDNPRLLRTLELAAEKAGWHAPRTAGHHFGIASSACFGSYLSQIAEVSIVQDNSNRQVLVHRITCVIDCGMVVNPRIVKAQVTGGIVYGLSAALYGNISIKDGRVQQSNFHDYPCLRIHNMPEVSLHLVDSNEEPGGVGEIGTPPVAAAVANAVLAATGAPIRNLPIAL